ncbi:MAG: MucBP domain-containing protein, partial [Clostridium paraputrificum]
METIKKGLADIKTENPDVQKNIDELNVLLDTPNNKTLYTVEEIENLIRKYENVEYVADKGTVTVKYVDENNEDLCDPIVIEREIGEAYTTEAKSFDGYTLKTTPENAEGAIEKETQTVIY